MGSVPASKAHGTDYFFAFCGCFVFTIGIVFGILYFLLLKSVCNGIRERQISDMNDNFSRVLALLRQEKGVSQRKAAGELGISQALLSHYENGVREPGLSFVVKACDYYHVSADFILGRTLARDGSMLTHEEVLNAAEPGNVLQGSVLATLQSKLLGGAIGVLFGLLGKLGDKTAINSAAAYLGDAVYQLYRHLYRTSGGNETYFSLDTAACNMGLADADMKMEENRYSKALREQAAQKSEFPDLSPETLAVAYPGRNQSLTQVLSTADTRLNNLDRQ